MREAWVWSLGWEDALKKEMANPLQYSGLENSIDCIVHGVAKSRTRPSDFHSHFRGPWCPAASLAHGVTHFLTIQSSPQAWLLQTPDIVLGWKDDSAGGGTFVGVFLLQGLSTQLQTFLQIPAASCSPLPNVVQSLSRLTLQCHGLRHTRLPCPSLSPRVCSNSCPLSRWCLPTISPSVVPFSSCPQSFPKSGSFPVSWLFPSGGQSIGASASASVLPMNFREWFPLGLPA